MTLAIDNTDDNLMNNERQMKRSVSSCFFPVSVNLDEKGNDNTRDALTLLGKRYAESELTNRKTHVTFDCGDRDPNTNQRLFKHCVQHEDLESAGIFPQVDTS
jgi:hypothetical protein